MNGRLNAIKAHVYMDKIFPHRGRAYEWLKRETGKVHIHDLDNKELSEITKKLERKYLLIKNK
jgi:hypothetical protein